jgi:hypothetical protein
MNNAFSWKSSKRHRNGTVEERELTIGAVVVTTAATLVLTLCGHAIWVGITSALTALIKVVRG